MDNTNHSIGGGDFLSHINDTMCIFRKRLILYLNTKSAVFN
jgi:hypothetical protein